MTYRKKRFYSFLNTACMAVFAVMGFANSAWAGQISLAWDPSTQVEVAGYKVYYGSASGSYSNSMDVGNNATAIITGLADGSTVYFAVTAYNADKSVESPYSNEVSALVPTAPTVDTTPPVLTNGAPSGSLAAGTQSVTMSVSTDEMAQCKFSYSAGVAYSSMLFTFANTGGLSHSTPISGLVDNSSYSIFVRCMDNAGNADQSDYLISFSVAAPANIAPLVSISSPLSGASYKAGDNIVISANASDSDGSVAKVEFFNGSSKLGEVLAAPYTFTISSAAAGSYSIVARATDNLGAYTDSSPVLLSVQAAPISGGQSLFTSQVPSGLNNNDGMDYELGMRFTANTSGKIAAIKFYKSSMESGSHVGKIYSSSGALLASVAFANESASGWQQAVLASPLAISANTEYTVSVNTAAGYYVDTVSGLASMVSNGNLSSVVSCNGVYGNVGALPTSCWMDSNYFRDVVFVADTIIQPPTTGDTQAPVASITSPANGSTVAKGTYVNINASASDNVKVTKVEFYVDNVLKATRLTSSTGNYSYRWKVPSKIMSHSLSVKAYDAAGNIGSSSISVSAK
ncbi:MAG: DUF4082 domain-containing protein [Bdellovibrio sp.]